MARLKLNRGHVLVDDDMVEKLSRYAWRLGPQGYAKRESGRRTILLHRVVAETRWNEHVDHINGDRLDCRRENLRKVAPQQNAYNRKPNAGQTYKGVCFHKASGKWEAYIGVNDEKVSLGLHDNERDAAIAYNGAAMAIFGKYAALNQIPASRKSDVDGEAGAEEHNNANDK